jgi:hypothetical protein
MSKNWIMLAGLLFLGSVGTSQGHPLDSPDIVYVDGLPCNRACQSYLAWSRHRTLSVVQRSAPVETAPVESAPEKPVLSSKQRAARRATAMHRESPKPAVRRIAKQAAPLRPAEVAKVQPAGDAALKSEPAPPNVAAAPPAAGAAATPEAASPKAATPKAATPKAATPETATIGAAPIKAATIQEQVAAATALAEQVTEANAIPAPQQETNNVDATEPSDARPTVSAATSNRDNRVALLIARPEIASVSDLSGKDVAIEDRQSALGESIRAAITAAGAADVRLNEEHMKAIDRLIRGEVPAAVLTLVSAEAAEWFPDIPGYRIFRIPLKARL